jgi:hypothetical protein
MRYTREHVFALQFASRHQRALLIHMGKLLADGPPDEVAARYAEVLHQPAMAAG